MVYSQEDKTLYNVIPLKGSHKLYSTYIGNKCKNLSKLMEIGVNVPYGFVVTTGAFDLFIEKNKIYKDINNIISDAARGYIEIKNAILIIHDLICSSVMPEMILDEISYFTKKHNIQLYAVRSSSLLEDRSNGAWAGSFLTTLNVEAKNIEESIIDSWKSLFSEESISYSIDKGISITSKLKMAILVQEMIQSDYSGVSFSIDPVDNNTNVVVIEAVHGLGEALVSGAVTPVTYRYNKQLSKLSNGGVVSYKQKKLLYYNFISKNNEWKDTNKLLPNIPNEHILSIALKTICIEHYFNTPQDIEWSLFNNKLYILQSRPVTTISNEFIEYNDSSCDLPKLQTDCFVQIYSSKGLPFLYEDMIIHNYICWETIIALNNGGDYVTSNINSIAQERERKKDNCINLLKSSKNKIDLLSYTIVNYFFTMSLEVLLSNLCSIIKEYGAFDSNLWTIGGSSFISKENECYTYISNNKNILREKIDIIFFSNNSPFSYFVANLSKKYNIPKKELYWYKVSEVNDLLRGNLSRINEVKMREKSSTLYRNVIGEVLYLSGVKSLKFNYEITSKKEQKSQIFIGNSILSIDSLIVGAIYKYTRDYMNDRTDITLPDYDYILVAEMTDPSMDILLKNALAVIVEIGGILSHTAISSREYGVPCIVGVEGILNSIKNGDIVSINTGNGEIEII